MCVALKWQYVCVSYFRWSFASVPLPYPAQWWVNLSLGCVGYIHVLDVSVHAMETENKYSVVRWRRGRKIVAKAIYYEAIKVMFSFSSNTLLNCLSLLSLSPSIFFSPSHTHKASFRFSLSMNAISPEGSEIFQKSNGQRMWFFLRRVDIVVYLHMCSRP